MLRYKPLTSLRVSQPYDQRLVKFFYFLECTPNSNFSANHEDNESDQENEDHTDNKNEGKLPSQTNTRSKSTIDKKFWCLYD